MVIGCSSSNPPRYGIFTLAEKEREEAAGDRERTATAGMSFAELRVGRRGPGGGAKAPGRREGSVAVSGEAFLSSLLRGVRARGRLSGAHSRQCFSKLRSPICVSLEFITMLMDLRAGIRGLRLFELCILCLEKLIILLPSQSHFLGVLLAFYSLNCDHFHCLYPVRPAITLVLRVRIYSNMINIPANGLGTTRIVSFYMQKALGERGKGHQPN